MPAAIGRPRLSSHGANPRAKAPSEAIRIRTMLTVDDLEANVLQLDRIAAYETQVNPK